MTLTLDIEHANSTDTLRILGPDDLGDDEAPSLQSARIERNLTRQPDATDTAEVTVYRDAWSEVEQDLDRTDDRLVIREDGSIIFGGRLADYQRDGVVVSVLIDSPKRDAIDAEPSGGNDVYPPQADDQLLRDELLSRVPTVDAGTVGTVDSAVAFSESHASPGKSVTKLARDADAEVRYRTTESAFELDYVARLGADRTAETLSPKSATVLGEPRVREQVTEDVTHVRVLGAGEGTAQIEAEAVADSYDAADDRPVYRQRADKDIQQSDRAQSLAETLVAEYDGAPEYVEVEFEVPRSVEPSLGDEFTVDLPAHDITDTLRITMLERLIDEAGDRFRAILSNRRHTGDTTGDGRALELDSLSEGNAGQIVRDSDSQGFDKVNSGEPQEWFFDYPSNVIGEFEATLRVESQPFRRPASAQGHSHAVDVTHPEHNHSVTHPSHSHDTTVSTTTTTEDNEDNALSVNDINTATVDTSWTQLQGRRAPFGNNYFRVFHSGVIKLQTSFGNQLETRLYNSTQGTSSTVNQLEPEDAGESVGTSHVLTSGQIADDDVVEFQARTTSGTVDVRGFSSLDFITSHVHDVSSTETSTTALGDTETTFTALGATNTESSNSTTALDPGIVTEDTLTPSNVSVDIDGATVVSGLDHPIQETVDVSGVLSAGANTITASSDTLGELRTSLTFEAVKNVGDTS